MVSPKAMCRTWSICLLRGRASAGCDREEDSGPVRLAEQDGLVSKRIDAAFEGGPVFCLRYVHDARLRFGQLVRQGVVKRRVEPHPVHGRYRDALNLRVEV